MKNRKNILSLIYLLGCLIIFFPLFLDSQLPIPYHQEKDGEVAPCADIIIWVHKTENGHTYKRLYNATTDTWLTDWILVS